MEKPERSQDSERLRAVFTEEEELNASVEKLHLMLDKHGARLVRFMHEETVDATPNGPPSEKVLCSFAAALRDLRRRVDKASARIADFDHRLEI